MFFYAGVTCVSAQTAGLTVPVTPNNSSTQFSYTNNAPLNTSAAYGLRITSKGNDGVFSSGGNDATSGEAVGSIASFLNSAAAPITLAGPGQSGFQSTGILLDLRGGNGGNYINRDGKYNAGFGGYTGAITGKNQAALGATGQFPNGLSLFQATTTGGNGGSVTEDHFDNGVPQFNRTPLGRPGGAAGAITLTNEGLLAAGSGSVRLLGAGDFAGLSAVVTPGQAGLGKLGTAGADASQVTLTNSGAIQLFLKSIDPANQVTSVYGILGRSTGADGKESYETGYSGGRGGNSAGTDMTVASGGDISVSHQRIGAGYTQPTGAGIGAFSTGGVGGRAWNGDSWGSGFAGSGGIASQVKVNVMDANVYASGDGLGVVKAASTGGAGGDGTNNQKSFSGQGGDTGNVCINLSQIGGTQRYLSTSGSDAVAIAASAIGGHGGSTPTSIQNLGGTAGDGGAGGRSSAVSVNSSGKFAISTDGDRSSGITALAKGGDGGNGGSLSTTLVGTGDGAGKGGAGEAGGAIGLNLNGGATISTLGTASYGLAAESIGGGGGRGGKIQADGGGNGALGGNGGNTAPITIGVNSGSSIATGGLSAHGILARSLSGTGGEGGVSNTTLFGTSGKGGKAGDTATINVANAGAISTLGDSAYGILAQGFSGAGGGSGSASSVFSSIIAAPGASGRVGEVTLVNTGSISTTGAYSYGVLGQSLSGSGGSSGASQLGVFSSGAVGATASPGGAVTFNQSGNIGTAGDFSHGAVLQSIGGGGGDGGSATGMISIGGNSGGGGAGGSVTAQLTGGSLATRGENANAILAQSIGGRGGNGGNATSLGVGLALSIGGDGGAGGNGGNVNLTTSSNISTAASKANGILAQSIGGGGGNGGAALSLAVSPVISTAVALGGKGANGQLGGLVNITTTGGTIWTGQNNSSIITPSNTLPSDAIGILAQSIGGGGGNGGASAASAIAIAVPVPEYPQIEIGISAALGGSGGIGGHGATSLINITNNTQLITQGQGSHGVLNQSIGGGGGNGGDSSAAATTIGYFRAGELTESTNLSLNIAIAQGGKAGAGGNGGSAISELSGSSGVTTFGDFSNGFVSQSIGGGGGNGGIGSGTTDAIGAGIVLGVNVGLGGKGGGGGSGGTATSEIQLGSKIETYGAGSHGFLTQSIGGGGGVSQGSSFGIAAEKSKTIKNFSPFGEVEAPEGEGREKQVAVGLDLEFNLGATSGSGGNAGAANAAIDGKIFTHGNDSIGAIVQSIGGGGGLAGGGGHEASADDENEVDVNGTLRTARSLSSAVVFLTVPIEFGAEINLGSFDAGASGLGGAVNIKGGGEIHTDGDWSHGILAQSIGGGGGKADSAASDTAEARMELDFALGGLGKRFFNTEIGERGEGNTATGADGGTVTADLSGLTITTGSENNGRGYSAMGIILQSVGGGGGMAVDASALAGGKISVGDGESEESDGIVTGNGGQINASGSAKISTTGSGAHGLVAQSIGGGGGIGGAGSSVDVEDGNGQALDSTVSGIVGGNSKSTGRGGSVLFDNLTLDIKTTGANAYGIIAQSIGGGGGILAVTDSPNATVRGTDSTIGGASRNSASNVQLSLTGDSRISTGGIGAHGMVAQSIGAGGGIAGYRSDGAFSVAQPDANLYAYGNAGQVIANLASGSSITTSGARAHGILAQSIGGIGGLYNGQAGMRSALGEGLGNDIFLNLSGNIAVTGAGSYGVFSQVLSTTPDSNRLHGTQLTIAGNVTATGTAVFLSGGKNRTTIASGGTLSGQIAVQYDSGAENRISNSGTLRGSILSGPSTTSFAQVENSGTYFAGSRIDANVANTGQIHLGFNPMGKSVISGSLTQSPEGSLIVDGEHRLRTGPLLKVLGSTILQGKIIPQLARVQPHHNVKIIEAEGTLDNRATLDTAATSQLSNIFKLGLRQEQSGLFLRTVDADFSPLGIELSCNANEIAKHLADLWKNVENDELDEIFSNLDVLANGSTYGEALQEFSPGASLGFAANGLNSQQAFVTSTLDAQKFDGATANLVGAQSVWARTYASRFSQEAASCAVPGYAINSSVSEAGAEWIVSPGLVVGGGVGYQYDSLESGTSHVSGSGKTGLAALTAKYEKDDWLFAAALSGSTGWFDTTRRITVPGKQNELQGTPTLQTLGLLVRSAYTFHHAATYVRPKVDASLVYLHAGSYTESGSSLAGLEISDAQQLAFILAPGVEAGLRTSLPNGMTLHSYASGSVSFQTADEWQQKARFANGSGNAGDFTTRLPQDQVSARIIAGGQLQFTEVLSGYLQYEGSFSKDTTTNGGAIGIQMNF